MAHPGSDQCTRRPPGPRARTWKRLRVLAFFLRIVTAIGTPCLLGGYRQQDCPWAGGPSRGASVSPDPISNAKLIALVRRFLMEHAKSASRSICHCPICVDARKLLEKAYGEKLLG